ncbi:2OG-Fe dioxygenase family protein [Kitasatospora sp. NPDC001095]
MTGKPTPGSLRADDFAHRGWAHGRLSEPTTGADWQQFASAWDALVPDAYLGPARCRRNRRYGRVLAHRDGTLEPLRGTEFFQSKEVNPVFGDQLRVFEPLTDSALASPPFARILREGVTLVNEAVGVRDWELGIHFIRVLTDTSGGSEPAPEGRHCDGHAYVAIHLIGRHHVVGGENTVYRRGEDKAQHTVTMTEPLETLLLSDTEMDHAVSEIRPERNSPSGWRDTMIVDFSTVPAPDRLPGRTHEKLQ